MNGGAPALHKGAALFVLCMGQLSQIFKTKNERSGIFSAISQFKKQNLSWWQQIKRTTVQVKTKRSYRLDSAPPGHHVANAVLHGDRGKD